MPKRARNSGNRRRRVHRARKVARTAVSRARRASKTVRRGGKARAGRVRVVRSGATRARKPVRPLPAAEMVSERLFLSSLERSLRDNRAVWEALAKR